VYVFDRRIQDSSSSSNTRQHYSVLFVLSFMNQEAFFLFCVSDVLLIWYATVCVMCARLIVVVVVFGFWQI
jgi:hypothetical protein